MKVLKYEISEFFINMCIIIIGVVVVVILGSHNVNDLNQAKKAESVLEDLKGLRVAIEEYYQVAGKYPELALEGAKDNLKILDYYDENGKLISFADIYGSETLPNTPENDGIEENNTIYDVEEMKDINFQGGWNYSYTNNSGEIHANLPKNLFLQGIDWSRY